MSNLSLLDRTMLRNQYKILSHLDPDSSIKYDQIIESLELGLDHHDDTMHTPVISPDIHKFTLDVINMYDALMRSENNYYDITFPGFSGSEEKDYMYVIEYNVKQDKRYLHGGHCINSHYPMVDVYRRQLDVYNEIMSARKELFNRNIKNISILCGDLSSDEIRQITQHTPQPPETITS